MKLSVVIPCYCSSKTIGNVVEQICNVIDSMNIKEYEIILVNDCSPDKGETLNVIRNLSNTNSCVIGIDLAKNSGQAAATLAGLSLAKGDFIAVGDDDGETPYENLVKMKEMIDAENYDIVCARFTEQEKKSLFRRFGTWMSRKMTSYTLETPNGVDITVFFLAKRFVVQEMLKYHNPYPFIIGLIAQTTHNIGNIDVIKHARLSGQSGYSFTKLLSVWMNGFTAFSIKPLRISSVIGIVCAIIGFIVGIITVFRKIFNSGILAGYTTTIAAILFIGGIIMLILGLIGEYVGRIYICLNSRPQYIIKETMGKTDRILSKRDIDE